MHDAHLIARQALFLCHFARCLYSFLAERQRQRYYNNNGDVGHHILQAVVKTSKVNCTNKKWCLSWEGKYVVKGDAG